MSTLVKVVGKVQPAQWDKIIEAAMDYVKPSKAEHDERELIVNDSSDFELEDEDEDLATGNPFDQPKDPYDVEYDWYEDADN